MIDEKYLVDLFCELVQIDSPSRQERTMAEKVKNLFRQEGCQVDEDGAGDRIGGNCGNLYFTWPGELPGDPILFAAHMDTVDPCLGKKAIIGDDRIIRSNGKTILGADDLAGLTSILMAIRSIRQRKIPHRQLEILLTVGEEQHLLGAQQMLFDRLTAREAYVLDASGAPGLAVLEAPGNINFVFEFHGQAAHAGIDPEKGISAIEAAARGIARLRLGRIDAATTANIGRIEGGAATNIVADYCRVTAECRSLQIDRLQEQAAEIRQAMTMGADETGARLEVFEQIAYYPYQISASRPVVTRFTKACHKLSLPVRLTSTGGGSDNNVLAQHGIEGIVISCGMDHVHSCQEQIRIDDLVNSARLVEALICED